jgi:hypothetical protein
MTRNDISYEISHITTTDERKSKIMCGKYREAHVLGMLAALAD